MKNYLLLFFMVVCFVFKLNGQVYVKHDATGANNGTSWINAYTDLQMALDSGFSGQIWVAAGNYYPQSDTSGNYSPLDPRTKTFHDPDKLHRRIYGGFAGWESSLAQRDFTSNVTVIDGDIGNPSDSSDNVYHLFYINRQGSKIFDHISFINGNASGIDTSQMSGGAIYADSSFISFEYCEFRDNHAVLRGGGIFATQCYAYRLLDCVGSNNFCDENGGFSYSEFSEVSFKNSHFNGNKADHNGGAVYIANHGKKGSPSTYFHFQIGNCIIENNFAADTGGAVYSANLSYHTYNNNIFKLNESKFASSIFMSSPNNQLADSRIYNTTMAYNTNTGGNIISENLRLFIINSILWENNIEIVKIGLNPIPSIRNSIKPGPLTSLEILNAVLNKDPLFVNAPADLNVSLSSQAINSGTSSGAVPTTDLLGQPRPQGGGWDIGAYEYSLPLSYEFNGPGDDWYDEANWNTGFNPPNRYNGAIMIHSNCIKPELPLRMLAPGTLVIDENVSFLVKKM